jgi:hypothetical protein
VKLNLSSEQFPKKLMRVDYAAKREVETKAVLQGGIEKALTIAATLEDAEFCSQANMEAERIGQMNDLVQAKAHLTILQSKVEKAIKAQQYLRLLGQRKLGIAQSIAHIDGEAAVNVRHDLNSTQDAEEVARLEMKADELIGQEARRQDARFVAQQAYEILQELGYAQKSSTERMSVPESVKTTAGDAPLQIGEIIVQRSDMHDHVLRLRVDAERGAIFTDVEATSTLGLAKAKSAEESICPDIEALVGRLAEGGIETSWMFKRKPGDVDMKLVTANKQTQSRDGKKSAADKQGKTARQSALERRLGNG